MKFEELQGKRVVFSGDCVPLDKDTDLVISTNIEAAKSRRARSLGIPVIQASQML